MTRLSATTQCWIGYGVVLSVAVLWTYSVCSIYIDHGLFGWVGTDFGQYYAQASALWSDDPSNIYRPESYTDIYQKLLREFAAVQEPSPPTSVPYPPIFAFLFTPFTLPSPVVGFVLWTALNLAGGVYLAWRAAQLLPRTVRPLAVMMILTSYSLVETLMLGQPQILLACAVGECYLALRRGKELAAGVWLSCLLLKPQYGLLLGPFLVWRKRTMAVVGAGIGAVAVIGGSILVAGWDGLLAYPSAVSEMAAFEGYWEENMINWRSVVLTLGPDMRTLTGVFITVILSGLTVLAVMAVCRGRWMGHDRLFAVQFTLVLIATLLISPHSLEYGAVMLTLPLAAVFGEGLATAWTRWSVLVGMVLPTVTFALTFDIPLSARILTGALLTCFVSLLVTAWTHRQPEGVRGAAPARERWSRRVSAGV